VNEPGDRISADTLADRRRVCVQELRRAGADALLLYATGSVLGNQSQTHAYLRYLCGFDGRDTPSLLVLPVEGPPILLTGRRHVMRPLVVESNVGFADVRHVPAAQMGDMAACILNDLVARRIAFIGYDDTPAPVWASLQTALPSITWIQDFAARLDAHRVLKTPEELHFHRKAASICDGMFQTLADRVHLRRSGFELKSAMEDYARDAGADYCDTWLTAAPAADSFRYHREECLHVPAGGDQLLAGVMLTYDGHWGHSVRTGSVGAPTLPHRRLFAIASDMFEAALAQVKPGEDLCAVNDVMDAVLHRYYEDHQVRRTRAGHGLGYAYEDPVISRAFPNAWTTRPDRTPVEARPGMLLQLHPHLFVPGSGGAMIGDMVLVTDTGYELLTSYPRELISWRP